MVVKKFTEIFCTRWLPAAFIFLTSKPESKRNSFFPQSIITPHSVCVCVCVCVYTHAQLVPQLEWVAIPPPGDLPNPGIEPTPPVSAVLQADSLPAAPHWFSLNLMFILESDQTPVRIKAENLESSAGS